MGRMYICDCFKRKGGLLDTLEGLVLIEIPQILVIECLMEYCLETASQGNTISTQSAHNFDFDVVETPLYVLGTIYTGTLLRHHITPVMLLVTVLSRFNPI